MLGQEQLVSPRSGKMNMAIWKGTDWVAKSLTGLLKMNRLAVQQESTS